MERIAVTARLRQGAEPRARELIAAGPPFDPGKVGLVEHSVYVGNDLVVFVFEGTGLARRLSDLVNERIYAASFGRWAEVLAQQPRVAHEAYHWDSKGGTDDDEADPDRNRRFRFRTEAVELGLELAAEQGAKPVFIHVAPALDTLPVTGIGIGGAAAMPHEVSEYDWAPLERATEVAVQKGLEAKTKLAVGNPVHEIVRYAHTIDANLIVIGSRGHGAIAGALLGSVSLGVLHEAGRPVLVVRGSHVPAEVAAV